MLLPDVKAPVARSYRDLVAIADVVRVLELVVGPQIFDYIVDLMERPGKRGPANQREFQLSVVRSHLEYLTAMDFTLLSDHQRSVTTQAVLATHILVQQHFQHCRRHSL